MICEYVHLPQNEDIGQEERCYRVEEGVVEFKGREVLYFIARSGAFTLCDGRQGSQLTSIDVPGYVVSWKCKADENGSPISQIEPLRDEEEQLQIRGILHSRHSISSINFL